MSEPMPEIRKIVGYLPVSHDLLCDFTDHQCDDTCPPRYVPATFTLAQRARRLPRRAWWKLRRMAGYRLVHKDRIDQEDDW